VAVIVMNMNNIEWDYSFYQEWEDNSYQEWEEEEWSPKSAEEWKEALEWNNRLILDDCMDRLWRILGQI